MEFRILGAFEVAIDGRVVTLDAAKPRALLALLLLHANEPVAADRLIEELWEGRPPRTARKVLQTYVSQLRRVLPDAVRTRPTGYELHVEPGACDAARFERLVADARDHDPPGAADALVEALALWRGPPLADFAYERWAQAEIARLQELRLVALEARVDAELAVGRGPELVGELETLVAAHPLRERLRGQLMLALYRSGRQADALAAYRDARRELLDELGIDPSGALQELERAILRHEPGLEPAPAPASPRRHAARPEPLPLQATSFVGRTRELKALEALAGRPEVRLLTLTGAGGAGKTRLALALARRLRPKHAGEVCFVDLSPIGDPARVAGAIADALGLRDVAHQGAAEVLCAHLRERSALLVLDNFEQVLGAARLVEELLESTRSVRMLVTSRSPLRLARERVYAVLPLELPAHGSDLDRLRATEAIALFVERAGAGRPGFALTAANASVVAELCTRLDGLPLALELAAARVALLSPRAILARLGHWLDLLKSSAPELPERHRTIRAAIEWSYELLRPAEQELFTSLGVFVGGFTIDGAEAVAARPEPDVLDGVEALLAASLLRPEPAVGDEPRFGMLELVREYALEQLAGRTDESETRCRHATFYRALAEEAEPALCDGRQEAWIERLDAERDDLRSSLEWSAGSGDADVGLRLGAALWRYWQVRGQVTEGRESLERLLARRSGSRAARAAAQLALARCAMVQGDFDALDRFVAASLPVHRKLGDERSVSFTLGILGLALDARGDRERALPLLEEALETARRSGDAWSEARARAYLGMTTARDDLTTARRALEESLRAMREVGDTRSVCWLLAMLGSIAIADADAERARSRFEEALAVGRVLGDTWSVAQSLESLGALRLDAGDHAAAAELLRESLTVARDARYRPLIAATLESLAGLALAGGAPERAACLLGCASVLRAGVAAHPLHLARAGLDAHVEPVRSALGKEPFAEAWAQGRALTLDEAVAYALRAQGGGERSPTPAPDGRARTLDT